MKLSVIFILILVSRVKLERTNNKSRLKLPIGEYRIDIKKIYGCNTTRQNDIHLNYYLTKTSNNSKEIKGNVSLSMPLDDNLSMDVDFSIRGADGNWKNNTYIFHAEQAYTTAKNFMSKIDTNGLGFNLKYPVPVGIYVATGFNASNFENLNYIPKEFVYGLYKIRFILTDKKHQYFGCFTRYVIKQEILSLIGLRSFQYYGWTIFWLWLTVLRLIDIIDNKLCFATNNLGVIYSV